MLLISSAFVNCILHRNTVFRRDPTLDSVNVEGLGTRGEGLFLFAEGELKRTPLKILPVFFLDRLNANPYDCVLIGSWLGIPYLFELRRLL